VLPTRRKPLESLVGRYLPFLGSASVEARKGCAIQAVADDVFESTIAKLPAVMADMLRVCRLTGSRRRRPGSREPWHVVPGNFRRLNHAVSAEKCPACRLDECQLPFFTGTAIPFASVPTGRRAMNTLRAVIISSGNESFFEAQLLELDIAVSASSEEALFSEIEHALIMEYHLATHHGTVPFASFVNRVPPKFEEMWRSAGDDPIGVRGLDIPDEVAEALANALHTGNRHVQVRTHRLAA
jgi:hypothetical protein